MTKVWIDTDIGTNPDDATALTFALKHPQIEVVGISIVGTQQEKRQKEAHNLLSYLNEDVDVFLGSELMPSHLDNSGAEHVVAIGPLSNISKLLLEDSYLGHLHVMGGVLNPVQYRGREVILDTNMKADLEAARIVLSQHENLTLSPLNVTKDLVLKGAQLEQVGNRNSFLKNRFDGYSQHLSDKFGTEYSQIILNDLLPLCEILGIAGIEKRTTSIKIQPDGTLLDLYPQQGTSTVPRIEGNPDQVPTPTVNCEVITGINSVKILNQLLQTI